MKKLFVLNKKHWFLFLAVIAITILCNANFLSVSPFASALLFAFVYNNYYALILSIVYFIVSLLFNLSFIGLVNSALISVVAILLLIFQKSLKKHNITITLLCCALSKTSSIYFSFTSITNILLALLDLTICVLFCYCCCKVIKTLITSGIQCFTKLQKVYVACITVALFSGLCNLYFFIDISKMLFITIILLSSLVLKHKTIYVASFIAFAILFSLTNVSIVSILFVYACLAMWISDYSKLLCASIICLADAIYGTFVNYQLINLLPVVVACIIYIAIPKKLIHKVYNYINGSKSSLISAYYVAKKQDIIKNKLTNMSTLFLQMQKCYRDLLIGNSNKDKAVSFMAAEIKNSICDNCINKLACSDKNFIPHFEDLLKRSIEKGKVNLLDVPLQLSTNCSKINTCLSTINQMSQEYSLNINKTKTEDDNKLSISLQFGGTSKLFAEFSRQFINNEKINILKSKKIKDTLLANNIVCKECMVCEIDDALQEIILVVRNTDALNSNIISTCEKLYPIKFEINFCKQTKVAGWSLVSIIPSNKYELVCGYASTPKNIGDKCGDNYVFTKLTNNKYLIAICDGMGHGEQANSISATAINLIESYYKCGLSNNIVVDSVNNLLLPASQNNMFTTLDASVIDISTGEVDFIKVGSTISVVKKENSSYIIDVESLPLGVVENVVPTTKSIVAYAGDVVVLVSDGIVDAFANYEDFCNFINNESIINIQLFAESILEEATSRNIKLKDDMTVIAYRILQRR